MVYDARRVELELMEVVKMSEYNQRTVGKAEAWYATRGIGRNYGISTGLSVSAGRDLKSSVNSKTP